MKKVLILLVMIACISCSEKTYFSSDSDAVIEYDRTQGRWQMIWTWRVSKGRVKCDTIPIIQDNKLLPLPDGKGS